MLSALRLDCAAETARIVAFIRQQMEAAGLRRAVIGLSGGVDSALVAALCAQALGPDQVRAVLLPYRTSNPDSEAHGRLVAEALRLDVQRFDISGMVDAVVAQQPDMSSGRKGNIMSRCRMVYLYDQSAACSGLVVGTSNRTETLLGYFTLYGDGAAALKPLMHLYKCQVRQLSAHLGLPEVVIDKAPSADLWAGQTDEGELGFTYDEADQVLYLLTEEHRSVDEIAAQGFEADTVRAIEARMRRNAFKLRPAAELPTQEVSCP
ncbi:MAG: NAD+ synthase [Anaerolineae bacterium]|jgi:NAD+ synthase